MAREFPSPGSPGHRAFQVIFAATLLLISTAWPRHAAKQPPANEPATISLQNQILTVRYNDHIILRATIESDGRDISLREIHENQNGCVTQVFNLATQSNRPLKVSGDITGSPEAFPCEADRPLSGHVVVRHVSGLSRSRLNRAVYDRRGDWLLSVDPSYTSRQLILTPATGDSIQQTIHCEIAGEEITFRFRPRFYQNHRGLSQFQPWNHPVWDRSVAGWCSWYAFKNLVTEEAIRHTADELAQSLKPWGLDYLQLDDGYQQDNATPEKRLTTNDQFPGGLKQLADYIAARGLMPGIWTNVAFSDSAYAARHTSWFVVDAGGVPARGRWINFILDGSNPHAIENLVRPVYRGLRGMGWRYYKLDALRHLRYEGYNSHPQYFRTAGRDPSTAFLNVVQAVREEIGAERFLLACWGVQPELAGLVDGCRIGDDGFGLESLTQYNSFNNIVWRNDPDHIELSEREAYRSCMATSLTGSLFMLTDQPEKYRTPLVEAARKSLPVLFTRPGQIYDVDPSRSAQLFRFPMEMSGSGERAFDASRSSAYDLFSLEIDRPYENWLLLGRTGESLSSISFAELGLPADREYLVFEFWSKTLRGSFSQEFAFGPLEPRFNCQLFCIRERQTHPQIVATSRHISCGAVDLRDCRWQSGCLSGRSDLMTGEPYALYLHEPPDARFISADFPDAVVVKNSKSGMVREIILTADADKTISWQIYYR